MSRATSSISSPSTTRATLRRSATPNGIAEGCRRGWTLLTKDRRIRYRADELGALTSGHLFCLADGNATLDEISQRFLDAMPAIHRAVQNNEIGFWHIHLGGRITRMWP